ncbi:hypothetical protein BIB8_42 [Mycobacterium phage BIB8]|uniref:Uncharacterized protein n=2 Tax=Brujitavirus brujita TaxID=561996 RepID=B5U3B3_9CAUD|nr:gp45 [Mycobacterium phage Brujita]ADL71227.1 hypothetical protein ISLAND3_45 [Mycobacterium phage Island3]WAW19128.1 hypothetical protein BIB10_42 [Mycobacterium phage BIB10]WAW19190.1 hypothetical protein BIB9_42 [Mycobacterium phage BIB9]WAW19252.1 hypothetical protein BIB8_42 [Mycobacterium phage BIB8]WAW19314.1 hypothetical protein BIB7_42 [Mycobacterium phage BIB7]WAW19376.1 hypothetical protein BIB6_42 [Mycobacterium phage BIB6]WAW19438.1 hypothetical protein PBI_BIB4_42 [Mycobacter
MHTVRPSRARCSVNPTETNELDDWSTDEWWLVPDQNETEK